MQAPVQFWEAAPIFTEVPVLSEIICRGCNRRTITSMSRTLIDDNGADLCLVAWDTDNEKIVKGCGYHESDSLDKYLADQYIEEYGHINKLD